MDYPISLYVYYRLIYYEVGVIVTGCTGGGTPAASASVYQATTTAPDIYKQRGSSTQVGGSVDIAGVSVGAEYSFFRDAETNEVYHGGAGLVGIGAPVPIELHGEIGYSEIIFDFNVFNTFDNLYIKIMEW